MGDRAPVGDGAGPGAAPAYYAHRGRLADWWTLLHPPYTAWHLAFVTIGACLAPRPSVSTLGGTLLAFFLAVGVAAHALDELHGRPLATAISAPVLGAAAGASLAGALAIGAVGVSRVGVGLVAFMAVGALLVLAYDLELFGGMVHTDVGFALAWGAFAVLTGYFAEQHALSGGAVLAAAGAAAWAGAQRALSTPARTLRRRVATVEVHLHYRDGTRETLGRAELLAPLERALRLSSWAAVLLAAGLAVSRLG